MTLSSTLAPEAPHSCLDLSSQNSSDPGNLFSITQLSTRTAFFSRFFFGLEEEISSDVPSSTISPFKNGSICDIFCKVHFMCSYKHRHSFPRQYFYYLKNFFHKIGILHIEQKNAQWAFFSNIL